ncbi:DUF6538 domain-containing protein [Endobacter medicaginis]|nr:DUF6538 domain-containing protein [Endobacter medicaginis]MCX5476443.1 tyrosine-type recombinase/integrase [Endobacter medicaginis]
MTGCVRRRGDGWYFRRVLPADVRATLGCVVIERTLSTTRHREALLRAAAVYLQVDGVITAVREGRLDTGVELLRRMRGQPPWVFTAASRDDMPTGAGPVVERKPVSKPKRQPPALSTAKPVDRRRRVAGSTVSEMASRFLVARADTLSGQTRHQNAATYRIYTELLGDGPMRAVARSDAGRFIELMRQIPASHGKARNAVPADQAIALTAGKTGIKRLSERTLQRHVSALVQLWAWALPMGEAEANPWTGFKFVGVKSGARSRRLDWSTEDLKRLLAEPWRGNLGISHSTYAWIVAIGAYSGMRLEEICRLRLGPDVTMVDGRLVLLLQEHDDGWTPKTEAGCRAVPVHRRLLEMGLAEFVAERAARGDEYLFGDLRASGPDMKRGAGFSREFSKHKCRAGVGSRTVFHSFRHSASTILRNTDTGIRAEWIDAVLGHENGSRSEGAGTYLKRIGLQNLARTIDAIEHDGVDFSTLLRSAPRALSH